MMSSQKKEERHTCVRCGRLSDEGDKYCIFCGAPLINHCGDEPGLVSKGCKHINRKDAAFCAKCGYQTRFYLDGLIDPSPYGDNS